MTEENIEFSYQTNTRKNMLFTKGGKKTLHAADRWIMID